MKEIIAIIPARGGSKGIPRKNLQPLKGKPLLAYTIEHARQTPAINRIVVSIDDSEIADVARICGAEVTSKALKNGLTSEMSENWLLYAARNLIYYAYSYSEDAEKLVGRGVEDIADMLLNYAETGVMPIEEIVNARQRNSMK